MEKAAAAAKSKNKILRFLPKAGAAVSLSFKNPPFSPGRDRLSRPDINSHKLKGFSGPIVSMIPAEARRKSKSFETTQEPTSPKVSCMGQIKHKNRRIISKKKHASLPNESKPETYPQPDEISKSRPDLKKKKPSGIKSKIFGAGRKADKASVDHGGKPSIPSDRAPSLSQMRRFASSSETLSNFDWTTAQIAPEDQDRGFCSVEDRGCSSDGEDDDVIVPFSAPILGAGAGDDGGLPLEPRKEINLWKRRTMVQRPKPLQLSS